MKKAFILVAMILMLASSVSAYWCYQEQANVSNACGGMATGTYRFAASTLWEYNSLNVADGSWTTWNRAGVSDTAWFIANYTVVPDLLFVQLEWMTQYTRENVTIPEICYSGTTMSINITLDYDDETAFGYCHNGTQYIHFGNITTNNAHQFYEEAVWWNISTPITLTLKNEQNGQLVNKNWTIEVWGDDFSTNYSIDGSQKLISNASLPVNYNFRYASTGYSTRQYYMLNEFDNNITLYVLNSSASLLTLYTISDVAGTPEEGVTLVAYRKMLASNEWEPVEMSVSDTNGQGTLNLEPYNVNYMFSIYDSDRNLLFNSTTPSTIPTNSIYFKIQSSSLLDSYSIVSAATKSLSFSNSTSNFTFTWSGTGVTGGKLEVIRQTGVSTTTICTDETSSSSGTARCSLADYLDDTATFIARGSLQSNSTWYVVSTLSHDTQTSLASLWGLSGALWAFFIIAVFAMFGIWNPAACVAFACLGVIVSSFLGLIPLSYSYVAGIVVIGLIGIIKVRT